MQRVGFVGLGVMGSGMAARLLAAGLAVTVYNRTAGRADGLAAAGATVCRTPAEAAAGADLVLISVATADAVREVLRGDAGVLAGAAPGAVIADLSTVSPDEARELAGLVEAAGARALDARVLGNARHARSGELRFMVGGAAADVDAARPVFELLGKETVHLGGLGTGAAAKVAMNLLMGVQLQSLAEAVVFGERAGLDRDQLIGMIAASGYSSPVMRFKSGVMARRDFQRADFRLVLMRKDLGLALADAGRTGVPMPATAAAHEVLSGAVAAGLGERDCAAVLEHLERMAAPAPE
ncbi:NAD(P)-dependent oxidoreductase [Plantactinospora sp. KBS50]|uniref:NAD(P)-dependent oxidoreductase n=1 Tax=Plantactinospora sp. KBS50 TaxID=2024580 RepID=UPI000BAACB64|nr:NAD(P)-dependent oxidoreductase [Plantactinospora sp. KBS50]ASW56775.1 oxidoreductase [Plantactinospora sp. KBS50]